MADRELEARLKKTIRTARKPLDERTENEHQRRLAEESEQKTRASQVRDWAQQVQEAFNRHAAPQFEALQSTLGLKYDGDIEMNVPCDNVVEIQARTHRNHIHFDFQFIVSRVDTGFFKTKMEWNCHVFCCPWRKRAEACDITTGIAIGLVSTIISFAGGDPNKRRIGSGDQYVLDATWKVSESDAVGSSGHTAIAQPLAAEIDKWVERLTPFLHEQRWI